MKKLSYRLHGEKGNKMKKVFARLTPWTEYADVEMYFDFKTESHETGLTVIGGDRCADFKSPEWEEIERFIETVLDELEFVEKPDRSYTAGYYYKNATELFKDYIPGFKFSPKKVHDWKEVIHEWERNGMEGRTACDVLEVYTGEKWDHASIRGCSQGDYADIYFHAIPDAAERRKFVEAIEAYYFGTGAEAEIHDEKTEPEEADDVSGFWDYIPIPYATENEIKEYLAENFGDRETKPDDVTLFIPEDAHTVTTYSYRTA